jgi:hypothetical protein
MREKPMPANQHIFLGVLLVLMALLLSLATTSVAYAGRSICRSDPIVTLSNGTVVTMTEDIALDPSSVRSVTYTLNAPRGTTITRIVYTGDIPAANQRVVLVANRDATHYHTQTHVDAITNNIAVTATLQVQQTGFYSVTARGNTNTDVNLDINAR